MISPECNQCIPKYTQSDLVKLVKEKNLNDLLKNSIDEEYSIITEILTNEIIFKTKHYILIEKILNLPFEELVEEVKLTTKTSSNQEIQKVIDKTSYIFSEYIKNKRLYDNE